MGMFSKARLSVRLRSALWHAYSRRCFYCQDPISFVDLEIDHLLRVSLAEQPDILARWTKLLGLGSDFDLNSSTNLVPTHHGCNQRKGVTDLSEDSLRWYFEMTSAKQAAIAEQLMRLDREERTTDPLIRLASTIEQGLLTKGEVVAFLRRVGQPQVSPKDNPLVICWGMNLLEEETLEALPPEAPAGGPDLYDWLEEDLLATIEKVAKGVFAMVEDQRNGETIGVRIACWFQNVDEVVAAVQPPWELLEARYFMEIYEEPASHWYPQALDE